MVKIRRNRQPRNWADQTHMRSASNIISAKKDVFNVQEMRVDNQILLIQRSIDKMKRQIARFTKKKNDSTTPRENKAILEQKILHRQKCVIKSIWRLELLFKQLKDQQKTEQTKKDNLAKEMKQHIKNVQDAEKFEKFRRGRAHESVFPSAPKVRVESVGGKKRVVQVTKKVFSEQPKGQRTQKVKVKNPNPPLFDHRGFKKDKV